MAGNYNRWDKGSRAYERWVGNPWEGGEGSMSMHGEQQNPWPTDLNTSKGTEYHTALEQAIVLEYNKLRFDPARYAKEVLVPMRKMYSNRNLMLPSPAGYYATFEGIAALEETITDLSENRAKLKPLPKLMPSKGLHLAAVDHLKDQAATGQMGHYGSDGSNFFDRAMRYCEPTGNPEETFIGENILYGIVCGYAKWTVAMLLIDDGKPSREHRNNALDPKWKWIGVSVGAHSDPRAKKASDHVFGCNIQEK